MTLLSRRKRPITAANEATKTSSLVLLFSIFLISSAWGGDFSGTDRTVTRSSSLQWLPKESTPSKSHYDSQVQSVQHVVRTPATPHLARRTTSAFEAPFEEPAPPDSPAASSELSEPRALQLEPRDTEIESNQGGVPSNQGGVPISPDNPLAPSVDRMKTPSSNDRGLEEDVPQPRPNGTVRDPLLWNKPGERLSPNSQRLEEELSSKGVNLREKCPSVKELKPITELTTNITPEEGDLPQDCKWSDSEFQPRSWQPLTFTWTASQLCHKPLYFEDEHLERYGHTVGPWLQPILSGGHFFVTVPVLPYKMGLELPNECIYTLGYYRPGSCAPYYLDPIPLSVRGALFEAGAWVGGIAIIP